MTASIIHCKTIRHIKILLPNAEQSQACCLNAISLQPHENKTESDAEKVLKLNFFFGGHFLLGGGGGGSGFGVDLLI